jgi:hypothetical protein
MVHHLPLGNLIANKINYTFAAIAGSHLPLRGSGESQVETSNVDRSISGPPRASLRLATCNRPFQVTSETRTIEIDGSILRRYASGTERVQESYTEVLARAGERDPAWPASGDPRSGGVNSRTEGQRGRDAQDRPEARHRILCGAACFQADPAAILIGCRRPDVRGAVPAVEAEFTPPHLCRSTASFRTARCHLSAANRRGASFRRVDHRDRRSAPGRLSRR